MLFQVFKKMMSVLYFRPRIGNSARKFKRKFIVLMYLRIWSKCSLSTHGISKKFNYPCKLKSSRIAFRKEGVSLSLETRIF